jgi:hypothetical protein
MMPEPLNGKRDDKPPTRSIAGHVFDFHTHKCSCGKLFSDIAGAPESAIGDDTQGGVYCHQGTLTRYEWDQIRAETERIFACAKS